MGPPAVCLYSVWLFYRPDHLIPEDGYPGTVAVPAEQLALDVLPLAWEPYELALSEDALNLAGELLAAISAQTQTPGLDLSDAGSIRRLPS